MAAGGTGGEGALGSAGVGGSEWGCCVGQLWGLWAPALLRGSSGRRPCCLGRAEPRARRHLLALRRRRSRVLSCPVPGHLLQRAQEPSWVVARVGHGKCGRCFLSFPCFNNYILVCGCFVSFRLSMNYWEVISECDAVGVLLALSQTCSDGVLTFALYVRESLCSCLCVLFVVLCILALSVCKRRENIGIIMSLLK